MCALNICPYREIHLCAAHMDIHVYYMHSHVFGVCIFVSVHTMCITSLLALVVLGRLMILLNVVLPGRMFGEVCWTPVS